MKKISYFFRDLFLVTGMLSLIFWLLCFAISPFVAVSADAYLWFHQNSYIFSLLAINMAFLSLFPQRCFAIIKGINFKNLVIVMGMLSAMLIALVICIATASVLAGQHTDGLSMAIWLWRHPFILLTMLALVIFAGFYPTRCKDLITRFGEWHFGH